MAVNVKQLCVNLVLSGHNVLVTGQAGTGKTCLMKEVAQKCQEVGKSVAIVCTTGIATLNFADCRVPSSTVHRYSTFYVIFL